MNYDKIIVELLGRIQTLEERFADLEAKLDENRTGQADNTSNKVSTSDIKEFILLQIETAKEQNKTSITLRASDIHRQMKLKSRFPMVCNAMRQCMKENDIIIHETASGYSSSLEILYYCQE